jgi:hypothetical protein
MKFFIQGDPFGIVRVDTREDYKLNAILSMVRTVFVSVILGAGAAFFSKDV